jgi:Beta-galactosidase
MRRFAVLIVLACLIAGLVACACNGSAKPPIPAPKGFFGVAPQSTLTDEDASYMKAGGIEAVRWPLPWNLIQPTAKGGYNWEAFDPIVAVAARHGLQVLPFVYATPRWISRKFTTMPIDSARARQAWTAFLEAAVKRYGPRGEFWKQFAPGVVQYETGISKPMPIRTWQLWNEANFFYFAYPASPQRFVKLLKLSSPVIKRADPGAKVILSGLFGEPTAKGRRGMPAAKFLNTVYKAGTKQLFDGIALHPYAVDAETLEELVEGIHEVTVENHDRVPLYITEMGWGSQNDFNQVAFEQGVQGQVEQMKAAYGYLLENRNKLDLKQVYWFSWKDLRGSCNFCDSVGFFRAGARLKPKPAWHAFVALTGGRARP